MAAHDLSPQSILSNLHTAFVGRSIICLAATPSTMDVARKAAEEGAAEGTVIVAEEQTAGRGRLGRTWLSPPGHLALSVILRPRLEELSGLNMVASLAVCRSIELACGLEPRVKWPNDVLIGSKKVCGILVENSLGADSLDWAVVGIGINVCFDPGGCPELASPATSLSTELGREVSRLAVLQALLAELERLYLALRRGEPVFQDWRHRLETLGREVTVTSGTSVERGRAEGVERNGSLLLRRPDGTLATIVAGDVTLRPSAPEEDRAQA